MGTWLPWLELSLSGILKLAGLIVYIIICGLLILAARELNQKGPPLLGILTLITVVLLWAPSYAGWQAIFFPLTNIFAYCTGTFIGERQRGGGTGETALFAFLAIVFLVLTIVIPPGFTGTPEYGLVFASGAIVASVALGVVDDLHEDKGAMSQPKGLRTWKQ